MGVEQGQRCGNKAGTMNTRTTGATSKQTPNWDVLTPYKTCPRSFTVIHLFSFYLSYQMGYLMELLSGRWTAM